LFALARRDVSSSARRSSRRDAPALDQPVGEHHHATPVRAELVVLVVAVLATEWRSRRHGQLSIPVAVVVPLGRNP
jgi:hypothetical protein